MSDGRYICPICSNELFYTGQISQDIKEKRYCKIRYHYHCLNCGYETTYYILDDFTMRMHMH